MNEPGVQVAPRDNPYFGLEYYDEKFGAWFFGREAEGSKIITNLRAARLTLLHAESGVGKSSLLRAGVTWRMRKLADDMFARRRTVRSIPVVFNSWKDDPCRELTECVGAAIKPYLADHPVPSLPTDHLDLAIEAASEAVNASLLIMLDQFEEYFLYRSREPVPERFADELARCLNRTDLRANFLIAIREDAYAGLGDLFKGRIPNVYGNYLHIDYLDRASAERAIREPLDVYNRQRDASEQVRLHDDLVEAVLDDVRTFGVHPDGQPATANGNGNIRIATPLLQLVMERVWNAERDEGSHELRLATLQKLRGVRMIADAHLGKALDSLGASERQTAIDMFDHLVTPSGGKIAESVSDLARRTSHDEEQVSAVLAKLDHERIVRPIPAAPGQDPMRFRRYEIFHDVLAPTINRAIAAREAQRRVRRIRRFAALSVALLIIVSAIAVSFAYLAINANNEKLAAESRQLAAEASLAEASNPQLSAQLALQALHLRHTAQAEEALRVALPGLQAIKTVQLGTKVYSAAFDPSGRHAVLSADYSGTTSIWDAATGRRTATMSLGGFNQSGAAEWAAYNRAGSQVAAGYGDGVVALFDAQSGRKLESAKVGSQAIEQVAFLGTTGIVAIASDQSIALWAPNGKKHVCCYVVSKTPAHKISANPKNLGQFVATTTGGDATIWTFVKSSKSIRFTQQPVVTYTQAAGYANDAEFSPDGSKILVAMSNGDVRIYDAAAPRTAPLVVSAGGVNAETAAFSPDGKQFVAGYSSGRAIVWDVATGLPVTDLAGSAGPVISAEFNDHGDQIVTASEDGTVRLWYAQPRELRTEFTIPPNSSHPGLAEGASYISGGILAAGEQGLTAFSARGQQQSSVTDPYYLQAAWDGDGRTIFIGDADGTLALWRAAGQGYVRAGKPWPVHVNDLIGVNINGSGTLVADLTSYFTLEIRSAATGQIRRTLNAAKPINPNAISPDDHQVVAGEYNGQVEEWNGTATKPKILGSPGAPIVDIEYNGDGREFVTASSSGLVTVWNARDGKPASPIRACASPSTSSFSSSGSKIVVACGDGTIRVFATASGQTLAVIQAITAGIADSASFSSDDKTIIATVDTGSTGYVQVWDAELATSSLTGLERIAAQRVPKLTAAQQQQYLNGIDQ